MEITTKQENSMMKTPLENLSKEDLLKKCKHLLALGQKAKLAKDTLSEECGELKEKLHQFKQNTEEESKASKVLIENLTQQKLNLFMKVDELKKQQQDTEKNFQACEKELQTTITKFSNLENENQSHIRQIKRLTDENEQLITHLDSLENDIQQLKVAKDTDTKDANCIEEKNTKIIELQSMLARSLEKVKNLQIDNANLCEEMKSQKILAAEKNKSIAEVESKSKKLVEELQLKNKVLEKSTNEMDDLNTELHKNRAIIEKLHRDVSDTKSKLNENQITGSQVTGDLENTNEKLKGKLKSYRSKIIKIASDVKILKQNKETLLTTIDENAKQVQKWKDQLTMLGDLLIKEINDSTKEKQRLLDELNEIKRSVEGVQSEKDSMVADMDEMQKKLILYENEQSNLENYLLQVTELKDEKNRISDELNESKLLFTDIENNNKDLQDELGKNNLKLLEANNARSFFEEKSQQLEEKLKLTEIELLKINEILKKEMPALQKEVLKADKEFHDRQAQYENDKSYLRQKLQLSLDEIKALQDKNQELVQQTIDNNRDVELNKLVDDVNDLTCRLKTSTLENNELLTDMSQMKQSLSNAEHEKQSISSCFVEKEKANIDNYITQIKELEKQNEQLGNELNKAKLQLNDTETKQFELAEELNACNNKYAEENRAKLHVEGKTLELERSLIVLQDDLKDNKEKLTQKIKTLQNEIAMLRNENTDVSQRLNTTKNNEGEMNKLRGDIGELTSQLKTSKRENTELLTEMNEMNEVLKERGETISKQQQYCEEILHKVEGYEKQLSEANKQVDVLSEKDQRIQELEKEIESLKEKQNHGDVHESSYADSECMSTSTVSRNEEVSRLKDLEGSWEERYGKLRNLALKLKSKVKELTAQLAQEQSEKSDIQNKLLSTSKTVQLLQTQCDLLQDNLENSKFEAKKVLKQLETSAHDIVKDKNKLATSDEIINGLQIELENFKLEKKTIENSNKNLLSQIQSLKKDNEAVVLVKRELESKIGKLEIDILSRDKNINEEIEKHRATRAQLQESNKECKMKSVLSLEMQDYERSLKDLTQKLDKRNEQVNELQNNAESQKSTIAMLREEVRLLEDRILNEESELTGSRTEISTVKKQLSDTEALISQKDNRIHEVMHSLEITRSENEQINAQLAKAISENQKTFESVRTEKEQFKMQVLSLEQMLSEVKESFKIRSDELESLRKEYDCYKIRAQSVLRQNQTRDVGLEERLNEEVLLHKGTISDLEERLTNLQNQHETVCATNTSLIIVRDAAVAKSEELASLLDIQKQNNSELELKYQQSISEHAEAVRSLKVHADTLGQCYRQQLAEQETLHGDELKELRALLEKGVLPTEEQLYTPPPMPREECEGSESIESGNSSTAMPTPLEKLLNSTGDTEQELSVAKEQLVQHEARLTHLTGLLADAEQDLAKHTQMNQLLKEEIRRQQRSVEREQHAENLEYMKNVIFKFITLNNDDERTRLIPVLNTILKLSPEETQKLNLVVKGSDPNGRGWGSYLPIWNSPKPS